MARFLKLTHMENIHTKNLLLNNLDDKTFQLVELQDLPGVKYQFDKVSIYLNVQKIVDKNISDVIGKCYRCSKR